MASLRRIANSHHNLPTYRLPVWEVCLSFLGGVLITKGKHRYDKIPAF